MVHNAAETGKGVQASQASCIKVEDIDTNNKVHLFIII